MPADACGTIRTDLTTAAMTAITTTTSRIVTTRELMAASLLRPGRESQRFLVSGLICYVTDRERIEPAIANLACTSGPPVLPVFDVELDAEAPGQVPLGEHLADRPGRQHR